MGGQVLGGEDRRRQDAVEGLGQRDGLLVRGMVSEAVEEKLPGLIDRNQAGSAQHVAGGISHWPPL